MRGGTSGALSGGMTLPIIGSPSRRVLRFARNAALVIVAPAILGAGGDEEGGQGCGSAAFSKSDAPDFEGTWDITYDDSLFVEITLGGAVYTSEIGVQGGLIEIEHDGQPLSFDLDCERPEVVCPSEVWPEKVRAEQRAENFVHQVIVTIPTQVCDGELTAPSPNECGEGTDNPSCDDVCDGELTLQMHEAFGVVNEEGDEFELLLGAGVASNGINCGLLGVSAARADVESNDPDAPEGWQAERMENGEVITAYTGACLWADDVDMDAELEAVVLAAELKLTTGFEGVRQ